MRTPAEGRSSAHQFCSAVRRAVKSLSPMAESADWAILKSDWPPAARLATGQLTVSPLFPRRPPPEPSTRSERMEAGNTTRSPGSAVNRGGAAPDHGTGVSLVLVSL